MQNNEQKMQSFSDYFLDKYLAGECSDEEKSRFENSLKSDESLLEQLRLFKERKEKAKAGLPNFSFLKSKEKTKHHVSLNEWISELFNKAWLKGAIATCAVACLILFINPWRVQEKEVQSEILLKGSSQSFLDFYIKSGASALIKGRDGIDVHGGDRLQFVVKTKNDKYVAVFARDSLGVVSQYAPIGNEMPLVKGVFKFGNSVVLDESLGKESYLALRCSKKHSLKELNLKLEKFWFSVGQKTSKDNKDFINVLPADCQSDIVCVMKVK